MKLQIKPHLLYKPNLNDISVVPDPSATYEVFDRVVIARDGYSVMIFISHIPKRLFKCRLFSRRRFHLVLEEQLYQYIRWSIKIPYARRTSMQWNTFTKFSSMNLSKEAILLMTLLRSVFSKCDNLF